MNIFIFGSNGMLGNYVKLYLSQFYNVISFTRKDYDLSNISINSLSNFLKSYNINKKDVFINCAGTIPHSSKQRIIYNRLYFTINSIFPIILSQICEKFDTKLIHITTDCVFSGKEGNYNENSIHDETNDYGLSKSLGEICNATIIRTSIIGEEKINKRSLLEWVISNKNKEINGYDNHYWNGVTCLQLAKIIKEIIHTNNYWLGVHHIFSPRSLSKYELISIINEIYCLNIKINKYKTEEKCDKTLKSNYSNLFNIPDLYDQIKEQKQFKFKK